MLSKISLNHVLIILAVAILSYAVYAFGKIIELKAENTRVTQNYENALKIDSLQVAIFKINSTDELEDLLDQNSNLKSLIDKSEVSNKRIQSLYYQQQKYIDNLAKKMDVSGIVKDIRQNVSATKQWKDSTACAVIEGNVTYSQDSLSVNVTSKQFNNNVVLIKHESRRKPINWLFGLRLGKRTTDFTPESDCGETKVTIIEKNDD